MTFDHKPRVLICNLAKDLLTMQFFMQKKEEISKENSMCRGSTWKRTTPQTFYTSCAILLIMLCHAVYVDVEYSLNKWCYLKIQREV